MLRLLRVLGLSISVAAGGCACMAYTLFGPLTAWQTHQLGYDVNAPFPSFGPMNLAEEYRWNIPVLYYGFTSDFLNYFGARGADEIEKAFQMLNALPDVSTLKLDDYPASSVRINHRAQALGLTDLKSFALQQMLYEIGVGDPTRYVYCIRNRWIGSAGCPPIFYHIIQRNFDPDSRVYSSYINGDLWTYTTILDTCAPPPDYALLSPEPVDPMALLGYRHSPVTAYQTGWPFIAGLYYTTFTRDDVGCINWIYRNDNYNVEHVPTGVSGGTNFLGAGSSPWGIPPYYLTNGFGTNLTGGTNGFVEPALRGGIGKLTWERADFDSILGGFFTPVTNIYSESVIVNGKKLTQGVQRVIQVPDILFDAADLQGGDTTDTVSINTWTITAWQDNDAINGIAGQAGPGSMIPSIGTVPALVLTLNSVGPIWGNQWPTSLSQADAIQPNAYLLWGSFDGSTNAPVVYPVGTSIEAVEAQVLGGN